MNEQIAGIGVGIVGTTALLAGVCLGFIAAYPFMVAANTLLDIYQD